MENTRISTTGSFPDELNASKLIMRPEQVAEEHFDPCLVQMDCRYDEAPLREFVRVPENESPHPQDGRVIRWGSFCERLRHGSTFIIKSDQHAGLDTLSPLHYAQQHGLEDIPSLALW